MNKYAITDRMSELVSAVSEKIRKMNDCRKGKSAIRLKKSNSSHSEVRDMVNRLYSFRNMDMQLYKL